MAEQSSAIKNAVARLVDAQINRLAQKSAVPGEEVGAAGRL
jgi:hypothetical protein